MEEALLVEKSTKALFMPNERFILKKDVITSITMVVEQNSRLMDVPFSLLKGSKITIVNAAPLSQVYTFTVDAFQTIIQTKDHKQLLFSIEKDQLDDQKTNT